MHSSSDPSSSSRSGSATMQDIANHLDLSISTVSRALRHLKGTNANTRARVLNAARELGYVVEEGKHSTPVKSQGLRHIGVFVETASNSPPPEYLNGMSGAAVQLGASLMLHYEEPDHCEHILNPLTQPSALRAGLLSGAVLVFWWPEKVVAELSRLLPVVSIMHKYPGLDTDMVGIDNEEGIRLLLRHLVDLRHRRIGFFGRSGHFHWAAARFAGYVLGLTQLNIPYNEALVCDAEYEDIKHYNAKWSQPCLEAERLVREENVTAFVCVSESAGWELHNHLTSKGIRIPEDVSITGFHRSGSPGNPMADLTSTSASYEALGAAALRRVFYRIQNPQESPRTISFQCRLYNGSTTGPAPARNQSLV